MERGKVTMKNSRYNKILAARNLRKEMTPAETKLWKYLSDRGMVGLKFRRQHVISGFIVDFYCPEIKLAVEIDGDIHDSLKEYDSIRQQILEDKGIKFLRFRNDDVFQNINIVLRNIKRFFLPSPQSGEGCRGEA